MEVSRGEHQWKQEPETRNYREALRRSIIAAKEFDGTEAKYHELMAELVEFEEIIKASSSLQKVPVSARETAAALAFHPERPRDIQNLLDLAIKSRDRALHHAFSQISEMEPSKNREKLLPLYVVRVDGVFLPTRTSRIVKSVSDENDRIFEAARFEERMRDVLDVLQSVGIYADDLVVMIGKTDPQMLRKESYAAIRIPRLERSVLVCDQINQATFVLRGDIGADELFTLSKEELVDKYGNNIKRLIRQSSEKWKQDLVELLGSDEAWNLQEKTIGAKMPHKKVDVREFRCDEIKKRIIEEIGPVEKWIDTPFKKRRNIFIEGMGMNNLARFFGVQGEVMSRNDGFFRLGIEIYGKDPKLIKALEIEKRTPEEWRVVLQEDLTPERWVDEPTSMRYDYAIDGRKWNAIATIFDVPTDNRSVIAHLKLGQRIWPDNPDISKLLKIEQRTREEWRDAIKPQCSPEQWARKNSAEIQDFKIDGKGVKFIQNIFKVSGNQTSRDTFLRLGLAIFPGNTAILRELDLLKIKQEKDKAIKKRSVEDWKNFIRSRYSAESWLRVDKKKLELDGVSIGRISRLLGVSGDITMTIPFLKMCEIIYPEDQSIKEKLFESETKDEVTGKRSVEDWRSVIVNRMRPEEWANLGSVERRAVNIDGVKINALATKFEIHGKPLENKEVFLRLGLAIWPENQHIKEALEKVKKISY